MKVTLTKEKLLFMNKHFCHISLSNGYISLDTYKQWIKIIDFYTSYKYQNIVFNNFIKIKNIKNIPNYHIYDINEPNFIIISSGQSNSGGWSTIYDPYIQLDEPNNRIQSYNINSKKWVIANLSNGSIGGVDQCRLPNQNLLAFQYAKHLIKNIPGIRPGIISYACGNKPIGNWVKFEIDEPYYDENIRTCNATAVKQSPGFIFEKIKELFNDAILQLSYPYCKKIDAIIWHQGESDNIYNSNVEYYQIALNKLIDQFSKLSCNKIPAFIGGTILKNKGSENINNVIRNTNNNRFYDFAELSNLNRNDDLHFTTEATRIGGKLYFDSYQKIMTKIAKEGIQ